MQATRQTTLAIACANCEEDPPADGSSRPLTTAVVSAKRRRSRSSAVALPLWS
jgi:hypothetical protein